MRGTDATRCPASSAATCGTASATADYESPNATAKRSAPWGSCRRARIPSTQGASFGSWLTSRRRCRGLSRAAREGMRGTAMNGATAPRTRRAALLPAGDGRRPRFPTPRYRLRADQTGSRRAPTPSTSVASSSPRPRRMRPGIPRWGSTPRSATTPRQRGPTCGRCGARLVSRRARLTPAGSTMAASASPPISRGVATSDNVTQPSINSATSVSGGCSERSQPNSSVPGSTVSMRICTVPCTASFAGFSPRTS